MWWTPIVLCLLLGVPALAIKVLEFTYPPGSQNIPIANWETAGTLEKVALPPSLAICSSIFVKSWVADWISYVHFWKLYDEEGEEWANMYIQTGIRKSYLRAWIGGKGLDDSNGVTVDATETLPPYFPQRWVRACASFDTVNGTVRIVADGKVLEDASFPQLKTLKDNLPPKFSIKQGTGAAIHAKFADLNVFSTPLSLEKMVKMTTAGAEECGTPGDYLSWADTVWTLSDKWANGDWADWVLVINASKVVEVDAEEGPCWKESRLKVYQIDNIHTHSDCMEHCSKIAGGRAPSLVTLQDWEALILEIESFSPHAQQHCHLWQSATEGDLGKPYPHWPQDTAVSEGMWRDYYTAAKLADYYHPFKPDSHGQIDAGDCLGLYTWWPDYDFDIQFNQSWWGGSCTSSWRGCPCQNTSPPPILHLRGLCPSSVLRTKDPNLGTRYTPVQLPNNLRHTVFIGGMSTRIHFNMSGSHWTISDSVSNISAVTNAKKDGYALGKQEWTITGDSLNCFKGEPYTTWLKLSGCLEGEFTCNDGQCVTMEQRCDQLPDCTDESDERGCQLLVLKEGYNKIVPPVGLAADRSMIPVTVDVSIVLLKIVQIEEENHAIQFQYEIIMEWKDNRVFYHNLKKDTSLNALPLVDIQGLWLPLVIYGNTDQKKTTRLGMAWEWSTSVTVTKQGNFTSSDLDELHEVEVFKGKENTLTMRQTYTYKFQCEFILGRYPFDTQECWIEMVVGTLDLKTVTLRPKDMWMMQHKDMTLFIITHQELTFTNATNHEQGLKMSIVLKRKIMSEMMTTYFPSILLMLITFATTVFKPIYFEASLSVNLTTMLVMTTIFISKMEGLPPTSDTKMIDMWLVMCQLVPFIEVMLVTAIEYYREEPGTDKQEGEGKEDTMSMVLMDLYTVKMDRDIPEKKEDVEEKVEVATNRAAKIWKSLCEEHQGKGVMDQDIMQKKADGEKKVEVATNPAAKIWKSLKEKHHGKGLIAPHLELIEEKIIPGTVVFFSIIYFVVAAAYYS